jgi:hypothetical protein
MEKAVRIFLITFIFSLKISAQSSFYDLSTIQRIEITFTQPNWDYMLDTAKAGSDGYIIADKVKINGIEFSNVGVKYKGNSSYNPSRIKNPFHIELDTYTDQNYSGYTDIKLSNAYRDPSFLREVLSYKIAREYMHAPQSNFANVYVNNQLLGLYSNSESVGKKFVKKHFGSKSNTFIKCNPITGAGPGNHSYPNLVYLGADSALYYARYELESDYGWSDLINLCDTLKDHITNIEEILNVDEVLWMLAFDNILVNLDSYLGQFSQNYYLYKDDYHRFRPIIWDLNESFGTFSETGTSNLNNTASRIEMTHLLHIYDSDWPLVSKLLSIPTYKHMYLAHMRTVLAENFVSNSYYSDALTLHNLIDASVITDPNKFYSYGDFLSNLNSDISVGNGIAPGLTYLMNGRKTWLSSLTDFTSAQPAITDIMVSNGEPSIGTMVTITARISNVSASGAFLSYRNEAGSPFARIQMYDDGLHGDGASSDGIFGSTIIISSFLTEYFIYAENWQIGIFSPQKAEMDFYEITSKPLDNKDLFINEFLASNVSTVADQNGEYDDWIEIFNNSGEVISLNNMYLSDSYLDLYKYRFPDNTTILPKSYLIVWADDNISQAGLHAGFKLSASGEAIVLTHGNAGILDSFSFPSQTPDISMQRCPDGTGDFVFSTPTYNAPNCFTTQIDNKASSLELTIYPSPFSDKLYINLNNETISSIRIIDLTGKSVFQQNAYNNYTVELNLNNLPQGLYLVIINDIISRKIIKE